MTSHISANTAPTDLLEGEPAVPPTAARAHLVTAERSDLLSRHVNKNHGPPGPDGKPTGGTNQHRGSNSASKAAKQSQFQSQETWNGTAMAQRRSLASHSAGAGADSEWEDLPYDGQEDSGAM